MPYVELEVFVVQYGVAHDPYLVGLVVLLSVDLYDFQTVHHKLVLHLVYGAVSIVIRETFHVLEIEVGAQRMEEVLLLLGELRYL